MPYDYGMDSLPNFTDPRVKTADALEKLGSIKRLTGFLQLKSRQTVYTWKEYLPPIHAYRLVRVFPELELDETSVVERILPKKPSDV